MKSLILTVLALALVLSITSCKSDNNSTAPTYYTAAIEIFNASSSPADVWIMGNSGEPITLSIPAYYSATVVLENGAAGINVNGGIAEVTYVHDVTNSVCPQFGSHFVSLSIDHTSYLEISNALIEVNNLSDNPATAVIYKNPAIQLSCYLDANDITRISIEHGTAGINTTDDQVFFQYAYRFDGFESTEFQTESLNLSNIETATLEIDNTSSSLIVENMSTFADMWITIASGNEYIIGSGSKVADFYDFAPLAQISKHVHYAGFTLDSGSINVTIMQDEYVTVELDPDMSGIWVENNSYYGVIEEIYISPSENNDWGYDDLAGDLYPGEWEAWICDPNNTWDIMVIDECFEYTWWDNHLVIDEVLIVDYNDYRSHIDNDAVNAKILNSQKYTATSGSKRHFKVNRPNLSN